MARPTLDRNPKFKLLIRRLGLPRPYVRGLLECMWDVAHESGNPALGTADEAEAAAEWPGDPGVFLKVATECRFVDETEPGVFVIHDYWDHAPDYVKGRLRMENMRKRLAADARGNHRVGGPSVASDAASDATPGKRMRRRPEADAGESPAKIQPSTVSAVWRRHVLARRRYFALKNGRSVHALDLTPEISAAIRKAIHAHGLEKATKAGVGIFYSPWHTGQEPGSEGKTYLAPLLCWRMNGKIDNVERFAQLCDDEDKKAGWPFGEHGDGRWPDEVAP